LEKANIGQLTVGLASAKHEIFYLHAKDGKKMMLIYYRKK